LYESIKTAHIACVTLSLSGFILRSGYMWLAPGYLNQAWVKRLPHLVDTLLLATGIGLLSITGLSPFVVPWLGFKLLLLLGYIVFGALGLRYGSSRLKRLFFCLLALSCALSMLSLALLKPAF
jgi:uncharacterized membrane protein SirB2